MSSRALIVSCTTDGFITDYQGLETFTKKDYVREGLIFTCLMTEYRKKLGFSDRALELKHTDPKGIISIRTRAQLGLNSKISALTGFNKFLYPVEELRGIFINLLKGERRLRFPSTRLMSGIDLIKKGGHVTMLTGEQDFYLNFDSKRLVLSKPTQGKYGLCYDTLPFKNYYSATLFKGVGGL